MLKRSVFIKNKCRINLKFLQLVIDCDTKKGQIPIEDLGFLIIEHHQTFISIPALIELNNANVSVIFCDKHHMPTAMLLNLKTHHIQQEIFTHQIKASEPLKKQLWQQTVKQKIKNQAKLLEQKGHIKHPLNFYASKVLSGDSSNREAAAAAYYWKNLFDFQFNRERHGLFPNNFLNYGYAILRAATARALAGSGLLNTLGIHHRNKYNAFALADDIMEPFRPMVDHKILNIMETTNDTDLTTEIKSQLINIVNETVYFKEKKSPLMVGLNRVSASLQQCFKGEKRKINYPELWN